MNKNLLDYVNSLANEKNVDKQIVFAALESAIANAVKKSEFQGQDADIVVKVDPMTGDHHVWRQWLVVDDAAGLQEPDRQILQWEAKEDYSDQGEMNVGDYVREELHDVCVTGRRFATDARQVILQKLREAERTQILDEFLQLYKDQTIAHGQVRKIVDKGDAIIEIGRLEARLPKSEMIPHEALRTGDRIRGYIQKVDPTARNQQVILSRSCNEFLVELMKLEVPEINEGLLEIKNVVREPGSRAKVAIQAKDKRIDPVGSCVGVKGTRIQNVTKELNGERIDIVVWADTPASYVMNALSPATVRQIIVHEDTKQMDVVVDEKDRRHAIGQNGQNVRLAGLLTGWEINILTDEEANEKREVEIAERRQMLMDKLDLDQEVAELLIDNGVETLEELAYAPVEDLLAIEDLDEEIVQELRSRARSALLTVAIEREEILKNMDPAVLALEGMTNDLAAALGAKNIKTLDDLADLSASELIEMTGIDEESAAKLITAARAHWA